MGKPKWEPTCTADWTAASLEHIRRHKRLVADHRGPLDRYLIARVGRAASVPGVHPHRLRHTLATQAINRGSGSRPSPRYSATARWK